MDFVKMTLLYDFYSDLLTDRQREIFEESRFMDLSLGEIGENHNVSRQAAHGILKRTEEQLLFYEKTLRLAEKHERRNMAQNRGLAIINGINISEYAKAELTGILEEMGQS